MNIEKSLRDIAHDLRTPLSIIQLTAETLIASEKEEETKEGLHLIQQQVARITALANDLSALRGQAA